MVLVTDGIDISMEVTTWVEVTLESSCPILDVKEGELVGEKVGPSSDVEEPIVTSEELC